MKKKHLILILIVVGIIVFCYLMISSGVITFGTFSQNDETKTQTASVDDLKDGCYYVWHNDKKSDISDDLNGLADADVFKICPAGSINWDDDTFVDHTIWFLSSNDNEIPTLYDGDKLLYVHSSDIPYKEITWERFADYGYTIGVANLIGDKSGHYHIENSDGNGFEGYVYSGSDVNQLNEYFSSLSTLFLDKVGGASVRKDSVSTGGTVLNLEKDKSYVCEWYTGSKYQDFKMQANVHAFGTLESFTTYDYEFLHSNVIEITIPEWFKTGYYYILDVGLFRYVSNGDKMLYNGKAYDSSVNWNDPIILYDEDGNVIYDPSEGVDKRNGTDDGGSIQSSDDYSGASNDFDTFTEESGDSGAGVNENFDDEIFSTFDESNLNDDSTEGSAYIE